MNKNIINKNLILYNIKNNNLFLIISMILGWKIIKINNKNNAYLNNIILGYNRMYKFFFKLKGFGFKWKYNINQKNAYKTFFLKLGFTHRISFVIKKNIKYKINKKRLIIKSRSYDFIRKNLNFIFYTYKNYIYDKKGIYLRGTNYKIKISKKKSKF